MMVYHIIVHPFVSYNLMYWLLLRFLADPPRGPCCAPAGGPTLFTRHAGAKFASTPLWCDSALSWSQIQGTVPRRERCPLCPLHTSDLSSSRFYNRETIRTVCNNPKRIETVVPVNWRHLQKKSICWWSQFVFRCMENPSNPIYYV